MSGFTQTNHILPRRILTGITRSPHATSLAAESKRLASLCEAELHFIHVGERSAAISEELYERVERAGIQRGDFTCDILEGSVSKSICRYAREHSIDLILAGALEKESALGYYVGSAARKLARKAPCSVLLLTEPAVVPRPFSSIIVPVNFDERSREAVRFALALAHREKETVLHIVDEYELIGLRQGMGGGLDEQGQTHLHETVHAEEESRLMSFLEDFDVSNVKLRRICLQGKKGWEVLSYARMQPAALLVFPAPSKRLGLLDQLFQHDMEFALQSLPCACLLHRSTPSQPSDR